MKHLYTLLALTGALALGSCAGDARATSEAAKSDAAVEATAAVAANEAAAAPVDDRSSEVKAREARTMDPTDPKVMVISAPTIQCGMCARNIRKALRPLEIAEEVKIDVKGKTVFVRVADNTTEARAAVESAISKAGYDTPGFKADPAAYEKLDDCCKIGGMERKG